LTGMYLCDASRDMTHTRARAHMHTCTHAHCTVYNCISVRRELRYGRKYFEKAEIRVSIFSSCLGLAFLFLYLGHPVVFGDTGIASYFPEGRWVNFRSRSRDHRACRSKCTSAIFGAGRLVAGRITAGREGRGWGRGRGRGRGGTVVPSRIPISTKYKI
jgi:hypothetical protein